MTRRSRVVYAAPANTVSFIVNSIDPDLVPTVVAVTGQDDMPVVVYRGFPDCTVDAVGYDVVVDAMFGDDNQVGNCLFPFKTILAIVATAAINGPRIKVLPGTYDSDLGEVFPITPAAGTTLSGLQGGQGGAVTITGTGPIPLGQETNPQAAVFVNAANVTISNFSISGDADGVYFVDASGSLLTDEIHGTDVGVVTDDAQIVMVGDILTDNADGLWVEQPTDTVVATACQFTHNTNTGVSIWRTPTSISAVATCRARSLSSRPTRCHATASLSTSPTIP